MVTNGFHIAGYQASGSSGVDRFSNPNFIVSNNNEANQQAPIPADMTLGNGHVHCNSNTNDNGCTVRGRIAGSSGNMAITVTGDTTGVFADTSNTDAVNQADLYNYMYDFTGGPGVLTIISGGIERTA